MIGCQEFVVAEQSHFRLRNVRHENHSELSSMQCGSRNFRSPLEQLNGVVNDVGSDGQDVQRVEAGVWFAFPGSPC